MLLKLSDLKENPHILYKVVSNKILNRIVIFPVDSEGIEKS